jgi:hypothetical protein
VILIDWWRRRRAQRSCFHHDRASGTSWVAGELIDLGRRKMFSCGSCGKVWIT